jgi:hypothetical protein
MEEILKLFLIAFSSLYTEFVVLPTEDIASIWVSSYTSTTTEIASETTRLVVSEAIKQPSQMTFYLRDRRPLRERSFGFSHPELVSNSLSYTRSVLSGYDSYGFPPKIFMVNPIVAPYDLMNMVMKSFWIQNPEPVLSITKDDIEFLRYAVETYNNHVSNLVIDKNQLGALPDCTASTHQQFHSNVPKLAQSIQRDESNLCYCIHNIQMYLLSLEVD